MNINILLLSILIVYIFVMCYETGLMVGERRQARKDWNEFDKLIQTFKNNIDFAGGVITQESMDKLHDALVELNKERI